MKVKVIITAAVLAASIAGSASATVDKCVSVTSERDSAVHRFKFDESKIQGEIVLWRCTGLCDWEIDGLPPWLKQVRTNVGYDLIGRPQAGTYNVKYKGIIGRVSANVPPDANWIGIFHTNQTWTFAPGHRVQGTCGPR